MMLKCVGKSVIVLIRQRMLDRSVRLLACELAAIGVYAVGYIALQAWLALDFLGAVTDARHSELLCAWSL